MKVGDIVQINQDITGGTPDWCVEVQGSIGMIVGLAKRMHIPAAKVMVMGEVAEFDLTELRKV